MKIKKKYYRIIESLIKQIYKFKNSSQNIYIDKAFKSAIYNTSKDQKFLLINDKKNKFIVHSNDLISKSLFIDDGFDFKVLKKALKILGKKNKKQTLINVGANIGSSCIKPIKLNYFKNLIAFEPVKKHFRLLVANIYLNNLENKVEAYNLALSNKKTKLKMSLNTKANLGDNRILLKNKNYRKSKIEIVKSDILDNFTKKLNKKNALIFMDVQGHEPYVLQGAKKTAKKGIPIILEFSPHLYDNKWLKNFSPLYKNYKFFYDLNNIKKTKFTPANIVNLFNKLKRKKDTYTDLLIL